MNSVVTVCVECPCYRNRSLEAMAMARRLRLPCLLLAPLALQQVRSQQHPYPEDPCFLLFQMW